MGGRRRSQRIASKQRVIWELLPPDIVDKILSLLKPEDFCNGANCRNRCLIHSINTHFHHLWFDMKYCPYMRPNLGVRLHRLAAIDQATALVEEDKLAVIEAERLVLFGRHGEAFYAVLYTLCLKEFSLLSKAFHRHSRRMHIRARKLSQIRFEWHRLDYPDGKPTPRRVVW